MFLSALIMFSLVVDRLIPATFTMRTYAVWGRKPIILVILGSIAIACVAVDIVRLSHTGQQLAVVLILRSN